MKPLEKFMLCDSARIYWDYLDSFHKNNVGGGRREEYTPNIIETTLEFV